MLPLLGALLAVALAPADEPWRGTPAAATHLGSYSSQLGARLSADGRLDTGALVARVVDLDAGKPLQPDAQRMGLGHTLVQQWNLRGDGFTGEGYAAAGATSVLGDTRLTAALRLMVTNEGDEHEEVRLALELRPGSAPDEARPLPSVPFSAGEHWSLDGEFVLRDGTVVAIARTPTAEVELFGDPASGDAVAARLVWHLDLPPGESRYVETTLVGPPSTDTVDEQAFRSTLRRRTYDTIAEELGWQAMFNGSFGRFHCADPRVRDAMVASVATLRLLGRANKRVRGFSDRPYGHPISDPALEPQMLGVLFEHRMGDIAVDYLSQLLAEAHERLEPLADGRRLAYLHGLARCVRLSSTGDDEQPLAQLIEEYLGSGIADGELAVDPWLDPDQVRQDLAAILQRSGRGGEEALPRFAWAETQAGSTDASFLAWRRALSEYDGDAAWAVCKGLLDRTTRRGFGSMTPGGEPDGRWALGTATLFREMLIGDHGDELHILPGAAYGMIEVMHDLESDYYPTRFGMLRLHEFHSSPRLMGGWLVLSTPRWPERILMHFPPGAGLRKLRGDPDGGTATVLDEQTVELAFLPTATRGLRFIVRRSAAAVAESAGIAGGGGSNDADGSADDADGVDDSDDDDG